MSLVFIDFCVSALILWSMNWDRAAANREHSPLCDMSHKHSYTMDYIIDRTFISRAKYKLIEENKNLRLSNMNYLYYILWWNILDFVNIYVHKYVLTNISDSNFLNFNWGLLHSNVSSSGYVSSNGNMSVSSKSSLIRSRTGYPLRCYDTCYPQIGYIMWTITEC